MRGSLTHITAPAEFAASAFPVPRPSATSVLGVTLVGVDSETGLKILFSAGLILLVVLLRGVARMVIGRLLGGAVGDPRRFWARQGVQVITAIVLVLGLLSIWITPSTDITTGVGLISAGLAFALQQVILSLAAYFVILRGDTFGVGDRITLGGVRGDVVRLGFLKTTIMEMGQPPSVSGADPAVWVNSRQYTGRLVTVTNGAIWNEPVYNYTRDFPYLWEEIVLPVDYGADRARVEAILLAAAHAHAVVDDAPARQALLAMQSRYALADAALEPAVFVRITDNWLELSLRFLVHARGVREVKDRISRQILHELEKAEIEPATAGYNIVGLPPLRLAGPLPGAPYGGASSSDP